MSDIAPPRPGYTRDGYNDGTEVVTVKVRAPLVFNWPLIVLIQVAILNVPINIILWRWAL